MEDWSNLSGCLMTDVTDEEFVRFMNSGGKVVKQFETEFLSPVISKVLDKLEKKMSGCFPSSEVKKCNCSCHTGGAKYMRTSNPPQPCCECEKRDKHESKCKCVSCLSEQIDELKNMYKADYETAKDIIFAGAQTHASILKLEHRVSEIEKSMVNVEVIHTMRQTIETWQQGCEVLINSLQMKVRELERFQEITHLQYQNNVTRGKPHKCPVCEGRTKSLFHLPAGGYWEDQCKSCEGKGIVWV